MLMLTAISDILGGKKYEIIQYMLINFNVDFPAILSTFLI